MVKKSGAFVKKNTAVAQRKSVGTLAVVAQTPVHEERAAALAQRLQLPLLPTGSAITTVEDYSAVVLCRDAGLAIANTGSDAPGPVTIDFNAPRARHRRRSGGRELLIRAIGLKPAAAFAVAVLDATAGLGRDAFVLASAGCDVALCERSPLLRELLSDALERAWSDAEVAAIAERMCLVGGDCRELSTAQVGPIEVIYLDPMFPARHKSAAVKKDMALLQALFEESTEPHEAEEEPEGSEALLEWALRQQVARVVVKRPLRAAPLSALDPSHRILGKAVRYDVYVNRKLALS